MSRWKQSRRLMDSLVVLQTRDECVEVRCRHMDEVDLPLDTMVVEDEDLGQGDLEGATTAHLAVDIPHAADLEGA